MTAFTLTESERDAMLKEYGVDHIIYKPLPDLFELKRTLDTIYQRKANAS